MTVRPAAAAATGWPSRQGIHATGARKARRAFGLSGPSVPRLNNTPLTRTCRLRPTALGSVAAIGLLALAGPAVAGSCVDQGNGQWLCSGPADAGDSTAYLGGVEGQPIVVDLAPGFGLTTTDTLGIGAVALYQRQGVIVNGEGLDLLDSDGMTLWVANTTPGAAVDVTLGGGVASRSTNKVAVDLSNTTDGDIILDGSADFGGGGGAILVRGGDPGVKSTGTIDVNLTGGISTVWGNAVEVVGHGGDIGLRLTGAVASLKGGAILVDQQGTGALSVETGAGPVWADFDVPAGGIAAINVSNTAGATGALSVTTGSGEVVGSGSGIQATNAGHGAMTIAVGGDVRGVQSYGIDLSNGMFATGGVHVSSVSGSEISGALDGIRVQSTGGALTMDLDGAVTASGGAGISAVAGPGSTGLDLAVTDVSGTWGGIIARLEGTGAARIAASGTIQGGAAAGIDLTVLSTGGAAEVTAMGAVSGGAHGIRVTQGGTGTTRVTTGAGTITATDGVNGIGLLVDVAASNSAGVWVEIGTGAVSGGEGLVISAPGNGVIDLSIAGNVTGHAGDAVRLVGGSGGATIDLSPGVSLSGAGDGLDVQVAGGGVTLTGTGDLRGTSGVGLRVQQTGGSGNLTLSTGAVSGGTQGILAVNDGAGGIALVAGGLVQGGSGAAVEASVLGNGGLDVTLTGGGQSASATGALLTDYGTGTLRLATGAASTLRGATDGARLVNHGGDLVVTAAGTIEGGSGSGLVVDSRAGASGVTVETATVTGGVSGIVLTQNGAGEVRVTASGQVTGFGGHGILAQLATTGSGDMILSTQAVTGALDGLRAVHDGTSGGISISTAGPVSGQDGSGITALNAVMAPGTAGGISITALGTVEGSLHGIHALNGGTGDLVLDARNTVTGAGGAGILVENGAVGGRLDLSVAGVSGQGDAIRASNLGSGNSRLTVTAGAEVLGTGGRGIALTHQGTGNVALAVHTGATVRGTGGNGVTLLSSGGVPASTRSVTIGLGALVEGSDHGIAAAISAGRLSVVGTGMVRGLSGDALRAELSGSAGDTSISLRFAEGAVNGITVLNQGLGAVQVLSDGVISGAAGYGILIDQGATTQAGVSVDVTAVSGRDGGILVDHKGQAGGIEITTRGLVEATGSAAIGLVARNADEGSGVGGITVETQAVSGGAGGILVDNIGSGVVSVTSHGLVQGGTGDAVVVQTGALGTDLSITTQGLTAAGAGLVARNLGTGGSTIETGGDIAAGTAGIDVEHHGAGALNLMVMGNVAASSAQGVGLSAVATRAISGGLTVSTAAGTLVEGGQHGAVIAAQGGTVRVMASGTIRGLSGTGVAVDLGTGVLGATLALDTVEGGTNGIELTSGAQGPVSLVVSGPASGGSGAGVLVTGDATQQDTISVETGGVVSGGLVGLQATHAGSGGALNVTALDRVEAAAGTGVVAGLSGGASGLQVQVADVTAAGAAVSLSNLGAGDTRLVASGLLRGDGGYGALVETGVGTGAVTVDLAAVQASGDGVVVTSAGNGLVTVDLNGAVQAGASGLRVNDTDAVGLDVTLDDTVQGQDGYGVQLASAGTISLTQGGNADISGMLAGLHVSGSGGAIDLTLAGTVTASDGTGISLSQTGAGPVSISATGLVTGIGTEGHGVVVETATLPAASDAPAAAGSGPGLDLALAAVTASQTGIGINHQGVGDLRLTASGTIQAGSGAAVHVVTGGGAGAVLLDLDGTVSGGSAGVVVLAEGSGPVLLDLAGPVLASAGSGVVVETGAGSTRLQLDLAEVTATDNGVVALHGGLGDLSLSLAGDLSAGTGVALDLARSQAGRIDLVVGADRSISGGAIGLRTTNVAGGETVLDLSGAVSGDVALAVTGEAGSLSRVTLRDGSILRGPVALLSDAGDSETRVATGAVIDGAVVLGEGDDSLSITGADLSLVTLLDGGGDAFGLAGYDALVFEDVSQGFLAEALTGWEKITLAGETVLGIGAGSWQAGLVDVGADAALVHLGGQVDLAGGLTLSGQLGLQNGVTGDGLSIGGDFTGGGVIFVDVDFATATADRVTITGDVLPGDAPTILAVDDLTTGEANGEAVVLVDVGGATSQGDFVLAGGPIYHGAFGYDLRLTRDGAWVLAEGFSIMSSSFEATPSVLRAFGHMPTLAMRQDARLRLSPDGRFAGWLRFSGNLQDTSLITQSGADVTSREAAGLEAGIELHSEAASGAGHWVLGGSVHTGQVHATVTSDTGEAVINATGWGLGASLSWLGDGGSWVDLQGRVGWQRTDLSSTATGPLLTGHGSTVWALGLEAGQRISLPRGGALVPQVQLSYASIEAGESEDSMSNRIVLGRNDTLRGRMALTYEFGRLAQGPGQTRGRPGGAASSVPPADGCQS